MRRSFVRFFKDVVDEIDKNPDQIEWLENQLYSLAESAIGFVLAEDVEERINKGKLRNPMREESNGPQENLVSVNAKWTQVDSVDKEKTAAVSLRILSNSLMSFRGVRFNVSLTRGPNRKTPKIHTDGDTMKLPDWESTKLKRAFIKFVRLLSLELELETPLPDESNKDCKQSFEEHLEYIRLHESRIKRINERTELSSQLTSHTIVYSLDAKKDIKLAEMVNYYLPFLKLYLIDAEQETYLEKFYSMDKVSDLIKEIFSMLIDSGFNLPNQRRRVDDAL